MLLPRCSRRRASLAACLAATVALAVLAARSRTAVGSEGGERLAASPHATVEALAPKERGDGVAPTERESFAAGAPAPRADEDVRHDCPFLPDEPSDVSVSVGDTSNGYLVQGARIDESEALGILPKQRERELRYGTSELVELLGEAAHALHGATKTKLWLGNVARPGGGDISYSISHNSGRDADVAFAYLDAKGRPVDPPELVRLGPSGLSSGGGFRIDVARTWRIVKSLVTSKRASVQWLFISAPLERQLLAHARRQREPGSLIKKASDAMLQPGGSGAHDDHLHVRVFCSERDVLGGCEDAGTEQPWHRGFDGKKRQRIASVAAFLGSEVADVRKSAVDRLVLLDAREELERLVAALDDREAIVRRAAVRAIAALGGEGHVERLARLFETDPDALVRIAVIQAAGKLGGRAAGELLRSAVGAPESDTPILAGLGIALGKPVGGALALDGLSFVASWRAARAAASPSLGEPPEPDASWGFAADLAAQLAAPLFAEARMHEAMQLAAIDAAGLSERFEPVEPLLSLLEDRRVDVRSAAERALGMLTNASLPTNLEGDAAARGRSLATWNAAWSRSKRAPRDAWLVSGFRAAGYDVRELSTRRAWDLVRATAAAPHVSFNAQRTLMRLFHHRPASLAWSAADACRHWLRFVATNRQRHRLAPPPATVWKACAASRDAHD